jgi:antitoxin (DNA-binding transcriptional repressor) of toxin-antitoxin stability system
LLGWSTRKLLDVRIIYNLQKVKAYLSRLIDRAANGEETIFIKVSKPVAKLVPFHHPTGPRQPGGWEGRVRISEDFDAPLSLEVQAAFEGAE